MNLQTDCNKKAYLTKREAETAANWRTKGRHRRRNGRPERLRVYFCPDCEVWHLTHQVAPIQNGYGRKPRPDKFL